MLAPIETCTGCGSCAAICPQNCITMTADAEGFRYPQADNARCVDCGLCLSACPVQTALPVSDHVTALAAKNKDAQARKRSSSGGIFTALAEHILTVGGAVCAAAYTENFSVKHVIIREIAELPPLRGAKYAQSVADTCFPALKTLLDSDIPVLFVGTPCQTAGLRAYLGREYDHLLLVDMICHGVPSPAVWHTYLRELETRTGAPIEAIDLRNKSTGWSRYGYSVEIQYKTGIKDTHTQSQDWFMQGFTGDLYLRPSCTNCAFKGVQRHSDLTLGDCWGIWEIDPLFDDDKGTSLLLIQSEKGANIWAVIRDAFDWMALETETAVRYNPSAVHCATPHPRRAEFFARLQNGEAVTPLVAEILLPGSQQKPILLRRIKNRLFSRR